MEITEEIRSKIRNIKLLLMDCDGVLTDGRLYYSNNGEELKAFHVHDGQGIVNWHKAGYVSGIITGRGSEILSKRASELGIRYLHQNSANKIKDFEKIIEKENISASEVAYIGDDISDLELLKIVGVSVGVKNCVEEVKRNVLVRTNKHGGFGAVRELVDLILDNKSK